MRAASLIILVAGIGTVAAALMLIPQENERFAMAMRDDRLGDALAILQEQPPEQMGSDELLTRFRLAENAGDTADAEGVLRHYLDRNPSDRTALDALANLYRATQQGDRYLETALALYWRDPSNKRFHDVVGRYRLSGDVHAELDLAEAALGDGWGDAHDIARTGLLQAAAGRLEDAADTLSDVPARRFEEFRQAHLTRIAVLLKLGRQDEALDAAAALTEAAPGAFAPLKSLLERVAPSLAPLLDVPDTTR